MKTNNISESLQEVWDWKEEVYNEVKDYSSIETKVRKRLEKVISRQLENKKFRHPS
jgi:hypothetical protein